MDISLSLPADVSVVLKSDLKGKLDKLLSLGYSQYKSKFYLRVWKLQQEKKDAIINEEKNIAIKQEFKNGKGTIDVQSLTIKTIEEALDVAEVDLDVWEVDRSNVNSWGVTMKINDTPVYRTNFQVKIFLKAKIKNTVVETMKQFIDKLPQNPTKYPPLKKKPDANLMLECGLVDQHFGMLAWGKETLSDYDLKIASVLYVEAVKKALKRISNPNSIGKILIPLGHDFFHINDQSNTTPRAKHQLDVDGRLPKVYSTGKLAAIKAIDYLRKIAPVEIVYVPGNHDIQISYFLCDTIKAWFKDCPDVNVNTSPTSRKYFRWGKGLLGMTHGLDEKMQELPGIMAMEVKDDWAKSVYREIHMGHYHKVRSSFKHYSDTINSVIVRTLPSLCGSDDYSYRHGWLAEGVQAAEFYLWDKEYGPVSYISVKAEEII